MSLNQFVKSNIRIVILSTVITLGHVCVAEPSTPSGSESATLTAAAAQSDALMTWRITVDRGQDLGQSFGSLFEVQTTDGTMTIGAGFQNAYNTRYRADRHAVQSFVRSADETTPVEVTLLPRPNQLCGTYLYSRDEVLYSTYGGVRAWDVNAGAWQKSSEIGGTEETMRVGSGILEFGDSTVRYEGRTILDPPQVGSYQLFFYSNGHLCFYHVNRGEGAYRPYINDADGFSRLYACPWTREDAAVDLSRAITMTLPIVGETTFAWGQYGQQILTGSNVGGFYVLENGAWRTLLKPQLGVSYQLYSTMSFGNRLMMGQYPTGRLFEYDGKRITDRSGWPPLLEGVSSSAREAQTTAVCGGEMFAGVWPWGELWRYHPDKEAWKFQQRMFSHPELSTAIIHPYDEENRGHDVSNLWGQRITSLVPVGDSLYVSTSAKAPVEWIPERFPFLNENDKWKSYGSVYRLKIPGHLGANTRWTSGASVFEFTITGDKIVITQDGEQIGAATLTSSTIERLKRDPKFRAVRWGDGIYGKFSGHRIEGTTLP